MLEKAKAIGHPLEENSSLDSEGVPGRKASHAEKKAFIENPGSPVVVSKEMCNDCFRFFTKESVIRKITIEVTDPRGTWTFHPDGSVVGTARNGSRSVVQPGGHGAQASASPSPTP